MGEMVEFRSNGSMSPGYLAVASGGSGPGIVVIQEWWGLNDQIRGVADRFANEGFTAFVPDLYRGVATSEPDEAGKLMMALNVERAAKDMAGAIDFLRANVAVASSRVGVVGYCMGGGLALLLATLRPDDVGAVVPYYGVIPWPGVQPDYAKLGAAVQGHYAENDDFASPETVRALETELRRLGKAVEFFIYPATDHAFANDHRPEVYDAEAAGTAWTRTLAFFREHLSEGS